MYRNLHISTLKLNLLQTKLKWYYIIRLLVYAYVYCILYNSPCWILFKTISAQTQTQTLSLTVLIIGIWYSLLAICQYKYIICIASVPGSIGPLAKIGIPGSSQACIDQIFFKVRSQDFLDLFFLIIPLYFLAGVFLVF